MYKVNDISCDINKERNKNKTNEDFEDVHSTASLFCFSVVKFKTCNRENDTEG